MLRKPVKPIYIVILVAFAILLCSAGYKASGKRAPDPKTLLKAADALRNDLYKSSSKIKYRHNWLKCIQLYTKVVEQYPRSGEAAWALYKSARMYRKLYSYSGLRGDLDRAMDLYRKLVESYPDHRLADDAQYWIGDILYRETNDPARAYVEFLKVDIKFPSGDMRPRARKMLDKLSRVLSKEMGPVDSPKKVANSGGLARVMDIRHWSTPTYTRVVVDLERPLKYRSNLLKADPKNKKPARLYVDIENAYVSSDIESNIPIKDGLLLRARAGQFNKDRVRVVLDIDNIKGHKIFHLYDPFRIVVDVKGTEKKVVKPRTTSTAGKRTVRKGIRKAKEPEGTVSLARQLGLNVKRIVIDPGHGGKDPGTYHGRLREKDIVMKLARALKPRIEKRLGCEVMLTRTRDVFIPLEKRTAFANVKKADLFISLHVNSHKQSWVKGIETYFLNMTTDKRAIMLAAAENATSEKNISDLQVILRDLMFNTKINESSRLAHEVQEGIMTRVKRKYRNVKSLGVKQAPFYVLIGAEMPSVLVETGFISNPSERRLLSSKAYLDNLADGIVTGIDDYIKSIELTYKGG
ncbi:MAG: N-acetylmuramoyl-L-alanine amidase [Deltaproteobacteria bacterium]|nr:N-acetylmuramoyl-L-alanine amidase [Deltaproteobacteria bacterium]MBW2137097.1 N-acetylmuramoyl-L-alanine amidase [Deltaproteobacteria bacterium]